MDDTDAHAYRFWVDFLLGGRLDDTYVVALADFRYEDFELQDYRCHPPIKAPIAV